MAKAQTMTIGTLSKQAGVGIETIRFYERRRLLSPKGRKESGYRVYDESATRTLRFIQHAKELGFTLEEIKSLLSLRVRTEARCGAVKQKAKDKLTVVEEKIKNLTNIRRALSNLISSCDSNKTTNACPILEAIEDISP